jgi:hypothetical protein
VWLVSVELGVLEVLVLVLLLLATVGILFVQAAPRLEQLVLVLEQMIRVAMQRPSS